MLLIDIIKKYFNNDKDNIFKDLLKYIKKYKIVFQQKGEDIVGKKKAILFSVLLSIISTFVLVVIYCTSKDIYCYITSCLAGYMIGHWILLFQDHLEAKKKGDN